MTRRVLAIGLVALGLVVALGFPLSVLRATDGLADDIAGLDGFEVLHRDGRMVSALLDDQTDVARLAVRPLEPVADLEAAFRTAMVDAGFSSVAALPPWHDDPYHERYRDDSFDADLYRIIGVDESAQVLIIGLAFFDTDSLVLAPFAFVTGLLLVAGGAKTLRGGRQPSPAHTGHDVAGHEATSV